MHISTDKYSMAMYQNTTKNLPQKEDQFQYNQQYRDQRPQKFRGRGGYNQRFKHDRNHYNNDYRNNYNQQYYNQDNYNGPQNYGNPQNSGYQSRYAYNRNYYSQQLHGNQRNYGYNSHGYNSRGNYNDNQYSQQYKPRAFGIGRVRREQPPEPQGIREQPDFSVYYADGQEDCDNEQKFADYVPKQDISDQQNDFSGQNEGISQDPGNNEATTQDAQ
ncbi:hypothetical protein TVAG_046880 [Trichomonas vaginalis G3]|uniref:Uncharacterized protein n=1 Tax=Trichomonas vaginalis (strain ATCC PRA-98 / G3) TaxID=412133 RepID=A2EAR3_TRIV3|nr:hypothetical protein TVAGG3_0958750 [Trichomonas vaginalis G3]EAY10266.1 hypothetical protein TVAG_046880 [Trichomonas vaginalis G3]KAI5487750.1 hypothetical protein TVAGG3_0958750 [Trichomonas vaginalis G3]|eukprot:XP_001322489.1 hypothetical protein [Trichomonas vaginalis G3]